MNLNELKIDAMDNLAALEEIYEVKAGRGIVTIRMLANACSCTVAQIEPALRQLRREGKIRMVAVGNAAEQPVEDYIIGENEYYGVVETV